MTRQRGPGLRPILTVPLPGGGWQDVGDTLEDIGTPSWRDVYQWKPGAEDAYAYIYEDTYRTLPARAAISIADPQLKARLLEENRRTYRPEYSIKNLADALQETAPSISAALSRAQGSNLRSALFQALEKAQNAPEAQKPAFLLAADWLTGAYVDTLPPHLEANSAVLQPLARAGVAFENAGVERTLRRTTSLVRAIAERYSETRWGERAFVDLLKRSGECADGDPDPFRKVIEDGTQWLSERPKSPYRVEVMFAVAESFETWWSLSSAVADSLVKREDYVEGSELARQRAIDWYQRAATLIPGSDGAFAARRKVVRLSLKLDTAQRAYSCHGGG